jgi:hypothetical protein
MRTAGAFDILPAGGLRMTEATSHPGLPGGRNSAKRRTTVESASDLPKRDRDVALN